MTTLKERAIFSAFVLRIDEHKMLAALFAEFACALDAFHNSVDRRAHCGGDGLPGPNIRLFGENLCGTDEALRPSLSRYPWVGVAVICYVKSQPIVFIDREASMQ